MEINKYIEHTCLKQDASEDEIKKLAQEAIEHNFLGICVNPDYVKFAKEILKNTNVKLVTVVNFPLGKAGGKITAQQAKEAIDNGADEIDTVINVSDIKNKKWDKIKEEIKEIKASCKDKILKVILETDLLTQDEIKISTETIKEAGADCAKTSTGFVKNGVGAKVEDVKIMKAAGIMVKASGGIKTKEQALKLIEAGADRLGTSSGCELIK